MTPINLILVAGLDALCDLLNAKPFVHSGYRCPSHNAEIGGVSDSQHTLGNAADIALPPKLPREIAQLVEKIPVFDEGGIGLYSSFVHVDVRGKKARWGAEINC